MEKVLTIEPIKESKDISKKISSKQLEARITAYTILFATIIVNILWWVGTLINPMGNQPCFVIRGRSTEYIQG